MNPPLSEATLSMLREHVLAHNSAASPGRRITLAHAREVYRQSCLDFDPLLRPNTTRATWASARLHALTAALPRPPAPTAPTAPTALTSAGTVVVDARWNRLHPRGRDGKFIETGGMVRLFSGRSATRHYAVGSVTGINPDGTVNVRVTAAHRTRQELVGKEQQSIKRDNIAQAPVKATLGPTNDPDGPGKRTPAPAPRARLDSPGGGTLAPVPGVQSRPQGTQDRAPATAPVATPTPTPPEIARLDSPPEAPESPVRGIEQRRAQARGELEDVAPEDIELHDAHQRQRQGELAPGQRIGHDANGDEFQVGHKVVTKGVGKRLSREGIVANIQLNKKQTNKDGSITWVPYVRLYLPDPDATLGYKTKDLPQRSVTLAPDADGNNDPIANLATIGIDGRQIAGRNAQRVAPGRGKAHLEPIAERELGGIRREDRVKIVGGKHDGEEGVVKALNSHPQKNGRVRELVKVRVANGGALIVVDRHRVEKIGGIREADVGLVARPADPTLSPAAKHAQDLASAGIKPDGEFAGVIDFGDGEYRVQIDPDTGVYTISTPGRAPLTEVSGENAANDAYDAIYANNSLKRGEWRQLQRPGKEQFDSAREAALLADPGLGLDWYDRLTAEIVAIPETEDWNEENARDQTRQVQDVLVSLGASDAAQMLEPAVRTQTLKDANGNEVPAGFKQGGDLYVDLDGNEVQLGPGGYQVTTTGGDQMDPLPDWDAVIVEVDIVRAKVQAEASDDGLKPAPTGNGRNPQMQEVRDRLKAMRGLLPKPANIHWGLDFATRDKIRARLHIDNAWQVAGIEDTFHRAVYDEQLLHAEELLLRGGEAEMAEEIHRLREASAGKPLPDPDRGQRVPQSQARQRRDVNPDLPEGRAEAIADRVLPENPVGQPLPARPVARIPAPAPAPAQDRAYGDLQRVALQEWADQDDVDDKPLDDIVAAFLDLEHIIQLEMREAQTPDDVLAEKQARMKARYVFRTARDFRQLDPEHIPAVVQKAVDNLAVGGGDLNTAIAARLKTLARVAKGPRSDLFTAEEPNQPNPFAQRMIDDLSKAMVGDRNVPGVPELAGVDLPATGYVVENPLGRASFDVFQLGDRAAMRNWMEAHRGIIEGDPSIRVVGHWDPGSQRVELGLANVEPDRSSAMRLAAQRGLPNVFDLGAQARLDVEVPDDSAQPDPDPDPDPGPTVDAPEGGGDLQPVPGAPDRGDEELDAAEREAIADLAQRLNQILQMLGQAGVPRQLALRAEILKAGKNGIGRPEFPGELRALAMRLELALPPAQRKQQRQELESIADAYDALAAARQDRIDNPPDPAPEPEAPPETEEPPAPAPAPAPAPEPVQSDVRGDVVDVAAEAQEINEQLKQVAQRAGLDQGALDKVNDYIANADYDGAAAELAKIRDLAQAAQDAKPADAARDQKPVQALDALAERLRDLGHRGQGQGELLPADDRDGFAEQLAAKNAEIESLRDGLDTSQAALGPDDGDASNRIESAREYLRRAAQAPGEDVYAQQLSLAIQDLARLQRFDDIARIYQLMDNPPKLAPDDEAHRKLAADMDALLAGRDLNARETDVRKKAAQKALRKVVEMRAIGNPNDGHFFKAFNEALQLAEVEPDLRRRIDNVMQAHWGQDIDRGPGFAERDGVIKPAPNITPGEQGERARALADRIGTGNSVIADQLGQAADTDEAKTRQGHLRRAEELLRAQGMWAEAREVRALGHLMDSIPNELEPDQADALATLGDMATALRRRMADGDIEQTDIGDAKKAIRFMEEMVVLGDARWREFAVASRGLEKYLAAFPEMSAQWADIGPRLPRSGRRAKPAGIGGDGYAEATQVLNGLVFTDGDSLSTVQSRLPPGWSVSQLSGGGVNASFLVTNTNTADYLTYILKADTYRRAGAPTAHTNGADAEVDVAMLYREFGFDMPRAHLLNPDSTSTAARNVFVMDFAGREIGVSGVSTFTQVSDSGTFARSKPSLAELRLGDESEVLRIILANAVIGQTDRHADNVMWGQDAQGNGHIFPIDNGLSLANAARGVGISDTAFTPWMTLHAKNLHGQSVGNPNALLNAAEQYINKVGRDTAKTELVRWAAEMRRIAVAKQKEFKGSTNQADFIRRAQWLTDNADEMVENLLRGRY